MRPRAFYTRHEQRRCTPAWLQPFSHRLRVDCMPPSFLLTWHAVPLSSSVVKQGVDRGMRISRLSADVDNMIASLEPPPPKGSVTLVAHGMSASVCPATIPKPDRTSRSHLFLSGNSCPRHSPTGTFIPAHGL